VTERHFFGDGGLLRASYTHRVITRGRSEHPYARDRKQKRRADGPQVPAEPLEKPTASSVERIRETLSTR
jgi:hypothetical protein